MNMCAWPNRLVWVSMSLDSLSMSSEFVRCLKCRACFLRVQNLALFKYISRLQVQLVMSCLSGSSDSLLTGAVRTTVQGSPAGAVITEPIPDQARLPLPTMHLHQPCTNNSFARFPLNAYHNWYGVTCLYVCFFCSTGGTPAKFAWRKRRRSRRSSVSSLGTVPSARSTTRYTHESSRSWQCSQIDEFPRLPLFMSDGILNLSRIRLKFHCFLPSTERQPEMSGLWDRSAVLRSVFVDSLRFHVARVLSTLILAAATTGKCVCAGCIALIPLHSGGSPIQN